MTRSILVIGATSPIGSAVSAELARQGWDVTGTSTRPNDGGTRVLDVNDEGSVRAALDAVRPRAVVTLASPRPTVDGEPDVAARAAASLHRLRDLSALGGARSLVFASSSAVYGTAHTAPRREQDQLDPASAYARLKAASESALASPAETDIATVSLRIFNVYGPGLHSSLINRMFAGSGDVPDVLDTDDFVRDYVHVSDVARAFAATVDNDKLGHNVVNVGTGVGTGNRLLLAARGAKALARPVGPGFLSSSVADISRLRELPGADPLVDLGELLRRDDRTRSDLIWG
ncbi:MAG: NAD-dependent epimerase/dehydratase family protein [Rhodoglobus sp.]